MHKATGTEQTRQFYDNEGWTEQGGVSVDQMLFGVKEDGPIRKELHQLHQQRIRAALAQAGPDLSLLECGCGGSPARDLVDLCARYTGADFSDTGLKMARAKFADLGIPFEFRTADVCNLPFADATFDAVYCAHMIYHIDSETAQEAAISELLRVVRPGGVVVLIAANPWPLAFPARLARRLIASTPVLGAVLNKVRAKPPLPYKPMSIGWMRERMARGGEVDVRTYSIPSTAFTQKVTEFRGLGRLLWKGIRWLDVHRPKASAYLGNFVMLTCRKAGAKAPALAAG
jgi:ubiquinone/menaquinone biosynthesis C-methylase UbiE